jgi:hypothetical protein
LVLEKAFAAPAVRLLARWSQLTNFVIGGYFSEVFGVNVSARLQHAPSSFFFSHFRRPTTVYSWRRVSRNPWRRQTRKKEWWASAALVLIFHLSRWYEPGLLRLLVIEMAEVMEKDRRHLPYIYYVQRILHDMYDLTTLSFRRLHLAISGKIKGAERTRRRLFAFKPRRLNGHSSLMRLKLCFDWCLSPSHTVFGTISNLLVLEKSVYLLA